MILCVYWVEVEDNEGKLSMVGGFGRSRKKICRILRIERREASSVSLQCYIIERDNQITLIQACFLCTRDVMNCQHSPYVRILHQCFGFDM